MVSAGKIFKLRERLDLHVITMKLKDFSREETFAEEPLHTKLLTEVQELILKEDRLEGIYTEDRVFYVSHRGERRPIPRTIEVPFAFVKQKDLDILIIMEKKSIANKIANQLSEALFVVSGYIVEAKISPDALRNFHEQNPEDTKIIFFDKIDIPNVNKLSLYGSGLQDTALYNDYCARGKIWYIVVTAKKSGTVVGITRDGVVTVFSNINQKEYLDYVMNEVFPLISL